MIAEKTLIEDCFIIKPMIFEDKRGFFMESFNAFKFKDKTGVDTVFVQDNQSYSTYGVLRGLHAQSGDYPQSKLVSVLEGKVLDVVVDARKDSPSYGKTFQIELSFENKLQLFIPKGCLHGFVVLSEAAHFFYKCDQFYDKESEIGVLYNDPSLNIDWIIKEAELIISGKDLELPLFNTL